MRSTSHKITLAKCCGGCEPNSRDLDTWENFPVSEACRQSFEDVGPVLNTGGPLRVDWHATVGRPRRATADMRDARMTPQRRRRFRHQCRPGRLLFALGSRRSNARTETGKAPPWCGGPSLALICGCCRRRAFGKQHDARAPTRRGKVEAHTDCTQSAPSWTHNVIMPLTMSHEQFPNHPKGRLFPEMREQLSNNLFSKPTRTPRIPPLNGQLLLTKIVLRQLDHCEKKCNDHQHKFACKFFLPTEDLRRNHAPWISCMKCSPRIMRML